MLVRTEKYCLGQRRDQACLVFVVVKGIVCCLWNAVSYIWFTIWTIKKQNTWKGCYKEVPSTYYVILPLKFLSPVCSICKSHFAKFFFSFKILLIVCFFYKCRCHLSLPMSFGVYFTQRWVTLISVKFVAKLISIWTELMSFC